MRIVAYVYSDLLLDAPVDPQIWGVEVDQVYVDLGERLALGQLLEDCQAQSTDYCLVRNLKELGQSAPEVSQTLTQLESFGITVIALEQDYQNSGKADMAIAKQQWSELWATLEKEQRRDYLRRGHARNRLALAPPPGKAPYGYRRSAGHYVVDRATAPVVKAFFEKFLLSGCLRSSVRYLEQSYGKKIAVATGRRWLTHPVYRGDLLYQNQTVIADTHAPLLSRTEAAQIDRLLRRNAPLPHRTASAPRSLAGLVSCGRCQTPWVVAHVTSRHQSKAYLYLRPRHCPDQPKCQAIAYGQFLEQVIEQICRELPLAVGKLSPSSLGEHCQNLQQAIEEKQSLLEQLPTWEQRGILDHHTHQLRRYQLKQDLAQLQQQLSQLPPDELQRIIPAVSLPQFWRDLSETERRFYFREFIRSIQLDRQPQGWNFCLTFVFGEKENPAT
ncbi:recombinase family protein [Synechocystis sp. PCC 7339]|uniref:recombinase family protein n=1 Tax=unclassified Synechocystis TaxID=2640012 RepID=UPI001BAE8731|nr:MULTISPECIES: recombinase family protein [unclassified Synechocystis]QUS61910.1 recombinase family protein [Synechocystis sp. PCC 7338]UAJ74104.1 recombinase family protein [Synechocystis sp. PCC 7339]